MISEAITREPTQNARYVVIIVAALAVLAYFAAGMAEAQRTAPEKLQTTLSKLSTQALAESALAGELEGVDKNLADEILGSQQDGNPGLISISASDGAATDLWSLMFNQNTVFCLFGLILIGAAIVRERQRGRGSFDPKVIGGWLIAAGVLPLLLALRIDNYLLAAQDPAFHTLYWVVLVGASLVCVGTGLYLATVAKPETQTPGLITT